MSRIIISQPERIGGCILITIAPQCPLVSNKYLLVTKNKLFTEGGKTDGVTQLFVFDLMKVAWEDKIPQSQAIELNVDIVLSSSPIHTCSETLLNLIKLEKVWEF